MFQTHKDTYFGVVDKVKESVEEVYYGMAQVGKNITIFDAEYSWEAEVGDWDWKNYDNYGTEKQSIIQFFFMNMTDTKEALKDHSLPFTKAMDFLHDGGRGRRDFRDRALIDPSILPKISRDPEAHLAKIIEEISKLSAD